MSPSASAARKKTTKSTKATKSKAAVAESTSESQPRVLRKINGVTYSVSLTEAAMLKALPEGQERRDLGSNTAPDGEIYSVYLKRLDENSVPVPCSEGSSGYNCSIPHKDRVSTSGWNGSKRNHHDHVRSAIRRNRNRTYG
jgi:hypothetical protein